jgi:prepilin-type N-terminal cleavage/methylation domain-containing protein
MKKLSAFTLVEILITIAIVGVVAAITIPNLLSKIQKRQVETQAKEAYSSILQAVRASKENGACLDKVGANDVNSMRTWFNTYIAPSMKITQTCYRVSGCWHKYGVVKTLKNETPNFESSFSDGWATIGCSNVCAYTFRNAKGVYFDLDGSQAGTTRNIFGVDATAQNLQMYFDVNGDRGPNVIGKDIYIMIWVSDDKFVPAGHDRSLEQVEQECKTGDGLWCLEYLIRNNWVIQDQIWNRKS